MNPEILLIAEPHEEWPQHVMELTEGTFGGAAT